MLREPLAIKTYPADPDVWSETLNPHEGAWVSDSSLLSLSDYRQVGNFSIYAEREYVPIKAMFRLHDGREFDGTRQNATLEMRVASKGVLLPSPGYIIIYDASGRKAWKRPYWNFDQLFHKYIWYLSSASDWIMDEGFDWRFIKSFELTIDGLVWIDEPYFSFYELELARLTILSQINGEILEDVRFRINGIYYRTPQYNLGLMPAVDYTIGIDSTNFKQWENGDPSPIRTINLGEAEELTITAFYTEAPPPPPPPPTLGIAMLSIALVAVIGIIIYQSSTS